MSSLIGGKNCLRHDKKRSKENEGNLIYIYSLVFLLITTSYIHHTHSTKMTFQYLITFTHNNFTLR